MRMAALTSNIKELSASTKYHYSGLGEALKEIIVSKSAHIACLIFDLFFLCLVQEHWALLYFRTATGSITLDKGIWVFCMYAFVFPNICKSMIHTVGHCYWCTNIVTQNWNKLYFQLLPFFCRSISSLKIILLLLSINSVPVKATKVINVSLKACLT